MKTGTDVETGAGAERTDEAAVRIGALVPLTRPGWVEAGQHLLAGLELAVRDVNDAGGIAPPRPGPTLSACRSCARQRLRALSPALGDDGAGVPFLRYLPERLSPFGSRVETALRGRLAVAPSFVAFEGYDTVVVLAEMLRSHGPERARVAESWPRVRVEGSRGQIQFARTPGISVWQWAWAPIQVVDRDPAAPDRFRILAAG